jgi:hypothetical protein
MPSPSGLATFRPPNRLIICSAARGAFQWAMPALTRRRSKDSHAESWQIFYGDVQVGTIKTRSGNTWNTPSWECAADSIRAAILGECASGTAATFDLARTDFGRAWEVFLSKRIEADFQAWRHQRYWTAEKYRRFDRGERMSPNCI